MGEGRPNPGDKVVFREVELEGEYNPRVEYGKRYLEGAWHNYSYLIYVKEGITYTTAFYEYFIDSYEWVKNNTAFDSAFLCWWDYGGMIEGFCEREAIAVYPSIPILDTIGDYHSLDEDGRKEYIEEHDFTDDDTIQDVAKLLTTGNFTSNDTQEKLKEHNISHVFTTSYDKSLAGIFLSAANKDLDLYFSDCHEMDKYCFQGTPTDKLNETLIHKMWEEKPDIPGLQLVYHLAYGGNNDPGMSSYMLRIFSLVNM
jgi:hypothetical protein